MIKSDFDLFKELFMEVGVPFEFGKDEKEMWILTNNTFFIFDLEGNYKEIVGQND